jgi:hypothetical protein
LINIIVILRRGIKTRKMCWQGHVACMGNLKGRNHSGDGRKDERKI